MQKSPKRVPAQEHPPMNTLNQEALSEITQGFEHEQGRSEQSQSTSCIGIYQCTRIEISHRLAFLDKVCRAPKEEPSSMRP